MLMVCSFVELIKDFKIIRIIDIVWMVIMYVKVGKFDRKVICGINGLLIVGIW